MHLLDKRSTRAQPVAAMIHDNSTDRTDLVPATHHLNFCPINFRCGGAWSFLVGGAICLVISVNERDLSLLTSYVEVCDALRCSGLHARYTDVFNEYIALADRPGKSLKFHHDGDRSLQLLVLNEEFLNPVNHRVFERKLRPKPFGRGHVCLGVTHRVALDHASPVVSRAHDVSQRVLEIIGREADGGRRCVPVGCGTARAGPPIDSRRGPVWIGAATKARAVDMPVEMPSRRSWLAVCAVTLCLRTCVLPASACGHPIWPVLKHGPRSLTRFECEHACQDLKYGELCLSGAKPEETLVEARSNTDVQIVEWRGCFVELCHGIESSKWAIFGKQNWRCGMNRKPGYGAKLHANLEPTKGVGRLRQQDDGHESRNPLRSVLPTLESTQSEVGSSGWKSTARRAVSGAPPPALENPEDRVPPTPGRTHNRIRSPRAGHGGPSPEPIGCRQTTRAASAARAGRRVPVGSDWERPIRGLPRASNSQLRTSTDKGNLTV
ncbi:hypothetical protein L6452_35519 [Arctium lappa]|uniref:Uncharacterized protein n=1 Tax=Arctium lappa TaxID=4217 RepID=A0ACB8Y7A0_ARCLA|nr:hypothetical protein L6452_35519 [Arctium lappa]